MKRGNKRTDSDRFKRLDNRFAPSILDIIGDLSQVVSMMFSEKKNVGVELG
jgi:hypothetical protein